MTIIEARGLSEAELITKKHDAREEIFNLRLQQQTGRLEKPSRLRELKRTISHIETVLSERRLGLKIESKIKQVPADPKKAKAPKAEAVS
jgi:large subunit ribosomal protein L29